MDNSDRYRKEQDLMFQELEEKELLQAQTNVRQRFDELQQKIKVSGVAGEAISELIVAGKDYEEIVEFLNEKIIDKATVDLARYLPAGISEEEGRRRIAVLLGLRDK